MLEPPLESNRFYEHSTGRLGPVESDHRKTTSEHRAVADQENATYAH